MLITFVLPTLAQCAQPPYTGPCRAYHTRWYYDPVRKKCYTFTYGGCHANDNNFEKEEKCSSACDGVTGTKYTLYYCSVLRIVLCITVPEV